MKAISLWQPWASLWCSPVKIHETRSWSTSYRGWLLVHAGKKLIGEIDRELDELVSDEFGNHWRLELPRGALVGAVRIIACESTLGMSIEKGQEEDLLCGDFSPGRYAWRRREYRRFARPVPYRGSQGFFDVPESVAREAIEAALAAGGV